MPAGFKTDLLLAKAEPISNVGSASGLTYLRGKKTAQLQPERGVIIHENSADTKHVVKTMVKQPIENSMLEQVDAPKEAVNLWRPHAGASSCEDL
ncbi:hypothetical protein llap_3031 [Limosa lapponica baueri]|uniref:Uncharacterized protein n=1 Tax=Limosa lapponica baueri TaxID=1758121 RepID=A0A2I0UKT4_LIMLA|nr:hypothetical protein llap_3031 [Limosa lapponica baueri]